MTDLLRVLPDFDVTRFANLIPALDKHGVTTSELLTLEASEIGKRTQLPLLDLKRLSKAVVDALHADLGVAGTQAHRRNRQSRTRRPASAIVSRKPFKGT